MATLLSLGKYLFICGKKNSEAKLRQIIHFHGQFQPYGKINIVTLAEPSCVCWRGRGQNHMPLCTFTPGGQCHMFTRMSPFVAFHTCSVPWDLLNGEEKADVVGIWGCDVVPLLTDCVRPSLLLASAQNSCFTLGHRSLSCHSVSSQHDRGVLVMWPLGVDISSWVTHEAKVEFPHMISLICGLSFPSPLSTGKIWKYVSYIAIILVTYYREVKWSHSY